MCRDRVGMGMKCAETDGMGMKQEICAKLYSIVQLCIVTSTRILCSAYLIYIAMCINFLHSC